MTSFAKETLPISLEEEMRRSYLDYAMSVIVGRALPDARDGLKPVHRRVLFAMHEMKNNWNLAYKKSARVVGDVMGKFHPHGDNAIYDTLFVSAKDGSTWLPNLALSATPNSTYTTWTIQHSGTFNDSTYDQTESWADGVGLVYAEDSYGEPEELTTCVGLPGC